MIKKSDFILSIALTLIVFSCGKTNENTEYLAETSRMQEVILQVGLGDSDPDSLNLSTSQRKIIDSLITLNPGEYNDVQKSLAKPMPESKRLERLLVKVGLGKINPFLIQLTASQAHTVDSLISLNPDQYNDVQKSLTKKKSNAEYAMGVILNVGLGTVNPDSIKLTASQRKTIDSLITLNPGSYNAAQKKLVHANSH